MIVGLGHDLCDAKRIERVIDRFGTRFLERVFTNTERERCYRQVRCAECFARRFSAKEALAKALGTGFRKGVYWRNIEVFNLPGGKPSLRLTGGALVRLNELVPSGMISQLDLSLTDDRGLAQSIVIISVKNSV